MVNSEPTHPPRRLSLPGRYLTLDPLDPIRHAPALWNALSGPANDWLWTYMPDGPFPNEEALSASLAEKATSPDRVFWALIEQATSSAAGYASLMRIDLPNGVVEVGNIMYSPRLQRTSAATEAMYLLARYVFEELGFRRYEWKCNSLNAPSRRAAQRLGFSFEGLFRQHMIVKGRNRDTAWFSMLDCEWPSRKRAFESWLDERNFDLDGRQRRSLEEFRDDASA